MCSYERQSNMKNRNDVKIRTGSFVPFLAKTRNNRSSSPRRVGARASPIQGMRYTRPCLASTAFGSSRSALHPLLPPRVGTTSKPTNHPLIDSDRCKIAISKVFRASYVLGRQKRLTSCAVIRLRWHLASLPSVSRAFLGIGCSI